MSIAEQTSLPETASSVNADCVAFVNDGQTHNVVAGVLGDMFTTPLVLDGGTKESQEPRLVCGFRPAAPSQRAAAQRP